MLLPVIVLAANAAEKSLKVCKLKYFWLAIYGPTTILTLHLYLHIVVYLHMEVLLLLFQPLDGFFSKKLAFLLYIDFGKINLWFD
jgi:hypothetical protein